MINGGGAEEKPTVTSPCDRESDGGDDWSHYSSCGGESEFERYCSANSAMGTPSSFRSNSFLDSDIWSVKSFKLGDENNNTCRNLGSERVLSRYQESESAGGSGRGNGVSNDVRDYGMLKLNERVEDFIGGDVNFDFDGNFGDKVGIGNENGETGVGISGISGDHSYGKLIDKIEGFKIDGGEDRDLSDESEALSRSEHSEGEDSMFGCGSDDERKTGYYYGQNVSFDGGQNQGNENQLVMNSAVAFGSDDWDDFAQENSLSSIVWEKNPEDRQTSVWSHIETSSSSASYPGVILKGQQTEVRSDPAACSHVGSVVESAERNVNALSRSSTGSVKYEEMFRDVKGVPAQSNEVSDIDESDEYLGYNPDYNIFRRDKDPVEKGGVANEESKVGVIESEMKETANVVHIYNDPVLKHRDLQETDIVSGPPSESVDNHHHLATAKIEETIETRLAEKESLFPSSSLNYTTSNVTSKKNYAFSFDQIEDHFVPDKTRDTDSNDFFDDMQDILLDSGESKGPRFTNGNRLHHSQFRRASRDGGSSASTSGTDYAYSLTQQPRKIDRIEVVGARQKKGEASFTERLVGVQKYTVYKIRVWSGEDHWEVERRYRDFSALYFRMKKLFADRGWTLPSPWSSVERESRKLFGNASPGVVADRSILIQECLQSVIHPKFSSGSLNTLIYFLSPSEGVPDSPASDTSVIQSPFPDRDLQTEDFSTLGKTISLVVQVHPPKSMKQMLDAQHYRCAGCHKNFDDVRTRVQGFVQALGWGKPRLCDYSGQLFCSSCHNNDYAVLPARVLHNWDFTRYPVSQLAKSYLDSINDKPMLCVSAVNPFLFSKVPTLQHVANIRNRIRAMMPYIRCPFRRSISKGLGSRKYLLDSIDFFALRDLVDLSKGVFSALPAMVETVSRKIQEHITEQCLACYDVGIPCNARKDCQNPLSLIFPFQEGEIKKCKSCNSLFHEICFTKIASCPCGARIKQEGAKQTDDEGIHDMISNLKLREQMAEPSNGLLAGLFSKVIPGRPPTVRKPESKGGDNIILMGSLPNTSL